MTTSPPDAPAGKARPITLYGAEVLHRKCQPVTQFDERLAALIEDMFASMAAANGVGLAANQIGVDLRVFVYDCPDATDERQVGHVVNPVIVPSPFSTPVLDVEGCLSIPGPHAEVPRPALATVTGFDLHGVAITLAGTGRLARCFQHETDHLNGVLYVDHLPDDQRRELLASAALGG